MYEWIEKNKYGLMTVLAVVFVLLLGVNGFLAVRIMTGSPTEPPVQAQTGETAPPAPETSVPTSTQPETTEPETTEPPQTETQARIVYEQVPLYFQTDYPDQRYGYGTIASSGCGVTSLAMVASYLTGHEYLPDELADYFGGHGDNNIERLEYGSDMLQLPWKRAKDVYEAIRAVREGDLAIALMGSASPFTDTQHFIVLAGVNEEGRLLVNDPYAPNYDNWYLKDGFRNGFKEGDIICGYSGGWIYDVSAMPEEPFVYVEEKPDVERRYPDITLTREDETLLAKIIWVEARGEPREGQQAIAEVVLNRMASPDFPDTVRAIVYSDNQFPSVEFLDRASPNQTQYDAIEDALEGPYILPENVVHFATYPVNDLLWGKIGGHYFCYQWEKPDP